MKEKKLTDDKEVIRLLEIFAIDNEPDGVDRLAGMALDLIRRLQYDNSSAHKASEEWREKYEKLKAELKKELTEHEEFTEKAKAEIERLNGELELKTIEAETERISHAQTIDEKAELQKQVDELKSKIEQGTLIELPCKVGDTVYFIDEKRWVWEMVVVEIAILKKNIVCEIGNRRKEVRSVWKENWGKTIFFTREEAEKRLKELQNG